MCSSDLPWQLPDGPAALAISTLKPFAWWRLNEFSGPLAADHSGHRRDAAYESHVAYYLEGPHAARFCGSEVNRAPHFVGGRLAADLSGLAEHYSLSLWIWNGMPNAARSFSGWFYSRDHNHGLSAYGEHLGIGGSSEHTGKLVFQTATGTVAGKTEVPRWSWRHVVLVRDGERVRIYLDGSLEIETKAARCTVSDAFFGGRSDNENDWEGRLDEIAIFDRALDAKEITNLVVK